MIDYKYSELFQKNSVDKQFRIKFDGGVITNTELHFENFELTESICSDNELRFGSCEASSIKFKISNIFTPLKNKWLTVSITLDGNTDNPFTLGNYKVYSDVPTADKRYREVMAYDIMYDILNTDVSTWYESLKFPMTLKNFRNSFLSYFGIEQEEANLPQDEMTVEKTVSPSSMSGKDVILSICEINGCFGKIGRDGKFKYVFLQQDIHGLYPDNDLYPDNILFPRNSGSIKVPNNIYITCTYEDFVTQRIDKLQIRQSENDVGSIVGTGNNCYIVQNNFLVYGKNTDELKEIAEKLFEEIKNISYRPFDATKLGNPCLETGDAIRIVTKYELVESYIFKRTIKGIQSLRESISSSGVYEYSEKVNSVNSSIIQLKGKTNELERSVEETKSTITDVEKGLQSQITQNAQEIELEVTRANNVESTLQSRIDINSTAITQRVKNSEFETYKTQTASEISQRVSKGSVVSEINQSAEEVKIKAGKISLEGLISLNGNFWIDEYGNMYCINATVDGDVNAKSFVCQDTVTIKDSGSGATATVLNVSGNNVYIDPNGVASSAIINTPLVCQKNVQVNEVSCNNANYLLLSGPYVRIDSNTGAVLLSSSDIPSFRPQADYKGAIDLGSSDYHWKQIFCNSGSISLSDREKKDNIKEIPEKYEELFFKVVPTIFKFKNENGVEHDRVHIGAISQQVEESMQEIGMTAEELSFFCKDKKTETIIGENGEEITKEVDGYNYGLRYQEWIMLNTHMLQKAYKKIEEQQKEIDELKQSVSFLLQKIGGNSNE